MAHSSKILIAAGTIGTAAAVGFLMQSGQPAPAAATLDAPAVETQALVNEPVVTETALDLSRITLTSSSAPSLPAAPTRPKAPAAPQLVSLDTAMPDALPDAPRQDTACPATLTATPTMAALVDLDFRSKCDPYARITIHHAGMSFTETTDSAGRLALTVPALEEIARFRAELPAGTAAVATAPVGSLVFYDRAVVQGRGQSGLSLHALEFGASHADAGHVSSATPREPSIAARGEGGFLMVLGDPDHAEGRIAQVYSFPSGTSKRHGDIRLSVEVEVQAGNCGRDLGAEVFEVRAGSRTPARDIRIAMPGCDAIGDLLVLKTPLDDLTIAMK